MAAWVAKTKIHPQAHTVSVSIQRVETRQEAHCVCGMWLRGVVWSIHRDCTSSFALRLGCPTPAYRARICAFQTGNLGSEEGGRKGMSEWPYDAKKGGAKIWTLWTLWTLFFEFVRSVPL